MAIEFLVKKLNGFLNIKTLIVGTKNLRIIADNSCSEPNKISVRYNSLYRNKYRPDCVVDPNPHGSALILVGWIWIRIRVGKNGDKNERKCRMDRIGLEVLNIRNCKI